MAQSFGLIGLAVMGENLALNVERNGFPISVFNRKAKMSSPPTRSKSLSSR
jgi:6-phosphogluconate dehydrogenase